MEWIPEPYPRSGGLAAAGFYKLLGRPSLDPLTVLVRETAQNSWDARIGEDTPVKFRIDGRDLGKQQVAALQDEVFVDSSTGLPQLSKRLSTKSLRGIYISDRNTKGLGGPLLADEADPHDVYDWVDFVLNVGKANTQGESGGTYGFGKTICYVVSSVNAVVVHSRTMHRGQVQTRLMACAIGEDFERRRKLFTGRHWWGLDVEGVPEPVTGRAATRIAADIGMPPFRDGELGTNLLIVDPDLGGRTPDQAMSFVAESIVWHLWPKLMKRGGRTPMQIGAAWNGEPVNIPDPTDRPPLDGFARAFRSLLDDTMTEDEVLGLRHDVIRCLRPKTDIGDLVTVPLVRNERATVYDGHDVDDPDSPEPAAVITGLCHHVALLRTPELVVNYLDGPAPPEGGIEWAGVFRAMTEHDGRFAAAEPPTHDTWNPDLLPRGKDRTIVKVGLRDIRRATESRWVTINPSDNTGALSVARVADELAHLVRPSEGKGPGRENSNGGRGGQPTSRNARVEVIRTSPVIHNGEPATLACVNVTSRLGSSRTRLGIAVGAALDSNESDPSLDPRLCLLQAAVDGKVTELSGTTDYLDIRGANSVEVEIIVARGPDTTVLFDLRPEPLESS